MLTFAAASRFLFSHGHRSRQGRPGIIEALARFSDGSTAWEPICLNRDAIRAWMGN